MKKTLTLSTKAVTKIQAMILVAIIAAAAIAGGVYYYYNYIVPPAVGPIKIGVLEDLSGAGAYEGQERANGMILAAEERKEILGNPIEIVIGDSTNEAEAAASEAERLVTVENVLAIFGGTSRHLVMSIASVTEKYGVPFITEEWDDPLLQQGWKYFFMIAQKYSDCAKYYADQVADFAPLLGKNPKELRVAVVYDDWAECVIVPFLERLKHHGIEPVYIAHNPWSTEDFTATIEGIKASGPIDVFVAEQIAYSATNFRTQMVALGLKPKVVYGMGVGWTVPEFGEILGPELAEGVFAHDWPTPAMAYEPAQEFQEKYQARFGKSACSYGLISYSTAQVLFDVIEKVLLEHKRIDRELLTEALRKVDIDYGVLPMYWGVKFDETGYNIRTDWGVLIQWQNGTRVVVRPKEVATGELIPTW